MVYHRVVDLITTIGLAMGAAWVSGIRLYACVATLGALGYYNLAQLPGNLAIIENPWVWGISTVLFVAEFVADKVPYFDSIWDSIHTFIRIPAGAVMAAAAFGNFDPVVQAVALLVGGGIAFTAHGTKASTRAAVNLSPEPVSNWAVSLGEDFLSAATLVAAIFAPLFGLALVVSLLGASFFVTRWLWRLIKMRKAAKASTESPA
ncbi:MAG: DUF4126 domain-containing protein [Fimbriimonadaceae bacterium]|jgi:hypothetical protein|nr:DUF4126 domain-containing protein [Fimbriimonadaceae bacterium]